MQKMMFNDLFCLTEAALGGLKTQTRRIEKGLELLSDSNHKFDGEKITLHFEASDEPIIIRPRYKAGEIVAVAQGYKQIYANMIIDFSTHNYHLPREDSAEKFREKYEETAGWTNKMFVKPDLMPHQVRITNVRLERLQDITDEECLAEGIWKGEFPNVRDVYYYEIIGDCKAYKMFTTPRKAYASLIDAISGKGTWDSNPYVFAYEFKLLR